MIKNIIIGVLALICLISGYITYRAWNYDSIAMDHPTLSNINYKYMKGRSSEGEPINTENDIPTQNFVVSKDMAVKIGISVLEDYMEPEELNKMSILLTEVKSKGYFVVTTYCEGKLGGGINVAILKKNGKILKIFDSE